MKKYFITSCALIFLLFSCERYEYDYDYYDHYEDTEEENQDEEGALTLYSVSGNQISKIKDYQVDSDYKSFQNDVVKHQQMWEHLIAVLPIEDRIKITEFEVFHGEGSLAGYVAPVDDNDLSKWRFGMAVDLEDSNTISFESTFTYVALHEFGHVLTLNDEQVDEGGAKSCDNYFTGEGCSATKSYINALFELGWQDIINELDEDDPQKLYKKYQERFVSDYAATNPGEDIAEVFSFFVINNREPEGRSIAERKIKLLYQFPELVELRQEIRENISPIGLGKLNSLNAKQISKIRVCNRKKHSH